MHGDKKDHPGNDFYDFQVDMSKCMVAFIDWYHERFDGEGGREKIKVNK